MRKRNSEFSVRLSGVGDGQHTYDFGLDQKFFGGFDNPELNDGAVKAVVVYEKKGSIRKLEFSLNGAVSVLCDRCLEFYSQAVGIQEYLILKGGEELADIDEHLLTVPEDLYELDLSQYLYEFIILNLPLKKVHPDLKPGVPGCSREMLDRLKTLRPEKKEKKAEGTDPRWNALKDLMDKE